MRQVPHPLIVGDGKMATHFGHYLSLLGIAYSQWSRKTCSDISLETLFSHSTLTVLLISDASLQDFINTHLFLKTKPIIHFSGALSIEGAHGAHPLMTFSQNLYDLDTYKKIPFIIEKQNTKSNTEKTEKNYLDFLPNEFFAIPAELKSYYHMLCVLSGNFTNILWQKFFSELDTKFQLPSSVGQLYLTQITQNIIQDPHNSLTGPLARNDTNIINQHLEILEENKDSFKDIYQAFVNLFENRGNKLL